MLFLAGVKPWIVVGNWIITASAPLLGPSVGSTTATTTTTPITGTLHLHDDSLSSMMETVICFRLLGYSTVGEVGLSGYVMY